MTQWKWCHKPHPWRCVTSEP